MGLYKIKACEDCGKTALVHIATKRCKECKQKQAEKPVYHRNCLWKPCDQPFDTHRKNQLFCCPAHKKEYHSEIYYRRKADAARSDR